MEPVRVQVRGVRSVRDVHVTGDAAGVDEVDRTPFEELMEVAEDHARRGRPGTRLARGLLHAAERRRERIGVHFEWIGRRAFRDTTHARPEMIPQRDAQAVVAAQPDRGSRADAVEAEERCIRIAGRGRARRVRIAHEIQGQ